MDPNEGSSTREYLRTISEAVAYLRTAGLQEEAFSLIDQAAAPATASYATIAQDTTRTTEYQLQQYAQVYVRTLRGLAIKLEAAAKLASSRDRDDAERVFGVKGIAGDPASLALSRRDAQDRVADLRPDKRQELLARATRIGDEVLARAIVEAAIQTGDAATTNAFSADRPALYDAVERLWAFQNHPRSGDGLDLAMKQAPLKPGALRNKLPYEIDRLAAA